MNKTRMIALLLLTLGLLGALPVLAQSAVGTVNTGRLNIRGGPGVGYYAITSVPRGTALPLIGRNAAATWVQVTYAGYNGWVNASYMLLNVNIATLPITDTGIVPPPANVVTGTVSGARYLNMRSGPGVSFGISAQLGQGDRVTVIGRNGALTWAQVRLSSGATGWVNASYLTLSAALSSVPQTDATGGPVVTPPPAGRVHVVQAGENLYRISLRYGVSMWAIAQANGILNLNQIYTGQQLVIP